MSVIALINEAVMEELKQALIYMAFIYAPTTLIFALCVMAYYAKGVL